MTSCASQVLPDYLRIDDLNCNKKHVLQTPAQKVVLPLTPDMQQAFEDMQQKFDQEENMAGLAAPQIGYPYRMIVFAVPDDPKIKLLRHDLTQTMPRTVWFNPEYEAVNSEMCKDVEGCFSIREHVGYVNRYRKIRYRALTPEGHTVVGFAEGFLARVIQHEIDHVNGKLCLDGLEEGDKIDKEAFMAKRREQLKSS